MIGVEVQLHSMCASKGAILLRVALLSHSPLEGIDLLVRSEDHLFPARLLLSKKDPSLAIATHTSFALYEVVLPLAELSETMALTFALKVHGQERPVQTLLRHLHFPITDQFKQAYCVIHRYCITVQGASLVFTKKFSHFKKEISLLWEILKTRKHKWPQALWFRIRTFVYKHLPHKPIWLLKDRSHHGNDNAEALFLYLIHHHPEIKAYFVIDKKSSDGKRLAKTGRVIQAGSRKHRLMNLLAEVCLSSQVEGWFIKDALFDPHVRDIVALRPFVFYNMALL